MSAPTPPAAGADMAGVPVQRGGLTHRGVEDDAVGVVDRARPATHDHDGDQPVLDDEGRAAGAGVDTRRLGMARLLTDPAIEEAISAFVASAPPLPEDLRARLARLLRTSECHDPADWEQP